MQSVISIFLLILFSFHIKAQQETSVSDQLHYYIYEHPGYKNQFKRVNEYYLDRVFSKLIHIAINKKIINNDLQLISNDELSKTTISPEDIIFHPSFDKEREKILGQLKLIETISNRNGISFNSIQWEQADQLFTHFLHLSDDDEFEFITPDTTLEMQGIFTERTSLLYYPPFFVSLMFARRMMGNMRIDRREMLPRTLIDIEKELQDENEVTRNKIISWLGQLGQSSQSFMNSLKDLDYINILTEEEGVVFRRVIDKVRVAHQKESARIIGNFFESEGFKTVNYTYNEMSKLNRENFQSNDFIQTRCEKQLSEKTDPPKSTGLLSKLFKF